MMRSLLSFSLFLVGACIASCDLVNPVDPFEGEGFGATSAIAPDIRAAMDGVYRVLEGGEVLGGIVVVKWNGAWLNMFAEKDGIVGALKAGQSTGAFSMKGRGWFNDSDRRMELALEILPTDGGDTLSLGIRPERLRIRGRLAEGSSASRPVLLEFARPVNASRPFRIVAHRGGFNNGGWFDIPDNSIAMIESAERFGANAMEIDVRITKDGVPVIFHDDNFTRRLVDGEYVFGPVKDFTFEHIRTFARLKNGEVVPKLTEALDAVLERTAIDFVEFDVKNPETIPHLFDIQRAYHEKALAAGRRLLIVIDLPSKEILDAYLADPRWKDAASMCELDEDDVVRARAGIWSPRWTQGTLTERVAGLKQRVRTENGLTLQFIPWTVNEPQFIDALLNEGQADGVLTDVPNLVAFKWYADE